jgi:hypothetical protein
MERCMQVILQTSPERCLISARALFSNSDEYTEDPQSTSKILFYTRILGRPGEKQPLYGLFHEPVVGAWEFIIPRSKFRLHFFRMERKQTYIAMLPFQVLDYLTDVMTFDGGRFTILLRRCCYLRRFIPKSTCMTFRSLLDFLERAQVQK